MEHSLTFVKERETKNTVKYAEKAEDGKPFVVGTLYVQKWAANGSQEIEVTVKTKK